MTPLVFFDELSRCFLVGQKTVAIAARLRVASSKRFKALVGFILVLPGLELNSLLAKTSIFRVFLWSYLYTREERDLKFLKSHKDWVPWIFEPARVHFDMLWPTSDIVSSHPSEIKTDLKLKTLQFYKNNIQHTSTVWATGIATGNLLKSSSANGQHIARLACPGPSAEHPLVVEGLKPRAQGPDRSPRWTKTYKNHSYIMLHLYRHHASSIATPQNILSTCRSSNFPNVFCSECCLECCFHGTMTTRWGSVGSSLSSCCHCEALLQAPIIVA